MKLRSEEKFAFLQLIQHVAKIDGEYGHKERDIIDEYCAEMGVENIDINQELFQLEKILSVFTSKASQRIAMLSLMALVHIDDRFGIHEHKTIQKIAQVFKLTEKEIRHFSIWGKANSALYEQALLLLEA